MGQIGRIYADLHSQVFHHNDGMPDYGVMQCPFCLGEGCDECMHMGLIPRTYEDFENDCINEMERRGDAERNERINK